MAEYEDYSQNMFDENGDMYIGTQGSLDFENIDLGHLPLSQLEMISPLEILAPSQQAEGGDILGISFGDSDLDMSPSFLQRIVSANDSEGSVKQEVASTLDIFNTKHYQLPLSSAKVGPVVAGPSNASCNVVGITYESEAHFTSLIPAQEAVVLDNWGGSLNFKVSPLLDDDKVSKKKVMYSEEQNKLFCNTGTAVKFKFEMAYEKMKNIDQYAVKVFLTFEDNDAIEKPVLRCLACFETEAKATDENMKHRLVHMIRPSDAKSDTKYFQHEVSKRCYIILPLKHPEPGMTFATKSFCFTCRNSCNRLNVDGKSRRAIAIMFCLVEKASGMVVGRSHTHVRVCSAPVRDYNKEQTPAAAGGNNRKRKSTDTEPNPSLPSPKLINLGAVEVPLNQDNQVQVCNLPGPGVVREPTTIRSVLRASAGGKFEDDGVSSSQETVYSCDESEHRIQLRDLIGDLRWVLKLKHDPSSVLRGYSNNVFNALKLVQELCNSARRHNLELRQTSGLEKSPDGGFHDVVQD